MPLDPSIPLSGQPAQIPDPFAKLGDLLQVQQMKAALEDRQRKQQMEQQQAAEEQQLAGAVTQARHLPAADREAVLSGLPPQARLMAEKYLSEFDTHREEKRKASRKELATAARAIKDFGYDPGVAQFVFQEVGQDYPEAEQLWQQINGSPQKIKALVDQVIALDPDYKPAAEPKAPEPFTLSPGQQRFDPAGKPIAIVPEPEQKPPASYQEWQAYKKEGGTLGYNEYQTMDANRKRPVMSIQNAERVEDIKEAARNLIANPRDLTQLRFISSLRGDQRLQLYNEIKRLNPSYDPGLIDRRVKFLDSYEDPKGRAAINRSSMNNILMHAADLSAVNKEYRRANVRIANMALNKIRRQYSDVYQQYSTTLNVLKEEIALYFAGGYAPMQEQQEAWQKILSEDATPNQIEAFTKSVIHVGLRRADTHNQQFRTMMGYDDPNILTPQAVKAGEHLGLASEMKLFGSGGMIGAPETKRAVNPFR